MIENKAEILQVIKQKANDLGFADCRILPVQKLEEEAEHLNSWLEQGLHGEMAYMERNIDKRLDPGILVAGAKTLLIVAQNYFTDKFQQDQEAPVISKYAYGEDYHFVMKRKLRILFDFIRSEIADCTGRIFVDSAPVLERAWARKAGFGWVGKNSNLISPEYGSFFFIGEIILDAELPYEDCRAINDRCGNCTRCIDACPTKAIVENRVVDARKCISYQTIELRNGPDEQLKGQFSNRVFGCDICQDVCPWNLKSQINREPAFVPDKRLLAMTAREWSELDGDSFDEVFGLSALQRTGYEGFMRNLAFLNS